MATNRDKTLINQMPFAVVVDVVLELVDEFEGNEAVQSAQHFAVVHEYPVVGFAEAQGTQAP